MRGLFKVRLRPRLERQIPSSPFLVAVVERVCSESEQLPPTLLTVQVGVLTMPPITFLAVAQSRITRANELVVNLSSVACSQVIANCLPVPQ